MKAKYCGGGGGGGEREREIDVSQWGQSLHSYITAQNAQSSLPPPSPPASGFNET